MKRVDSQAATRAQVTPPIDGRERRRLLDAITRQDFTTFVQRCFTSLSPGTQFAPNWHIEAMAYHLEQVRLGKIKRLIINMPPRSLKSIVSSVSFPAYLLGHDPTKRIICVSYGSDLATEHANDCRLILKSAWYWLLFPGTVVSAIKDTESEFSTTWHGYRLTTSLDGSITGRGGDVIIIDDPLKPVDALSQAKREKVNQWYFNTLVSRLDDKRNGAIILVMQRLHLNDLTGVLLRGSEDWSVLTLKAIADEDEKVQIGKNSFYSRSEGEVLHKSREPIEISGISQRAIGLLHICCAISAASDSAGWWLDQSYLDSALRDVARRRFNTGHFIAGYRKQRRL